MACGVEGELRLGQERCELTGWIKKEHFVWINKEAI